MDEPFPQRERPFLLVGITLFPLPCPCDYAVVVNKFIQDKAKRASKRQSNRSFGAEPTVTMEAGRLQGKLLAKPLVVHDHVFKVSLAPESVNELRRWIVKAASGQDCPSEFNFPAVDQTVPKAWINAYDVMDALKETSPCVVERRSRTV